MVKLKEVPYTYERALGTCYIMSNTKRATNMSTLHGTFKWVGHKEMGTWYMFMTITRGGANMCTFQAHANDLSIRRKKRRANMCTLHDTC